MNVKWHYLERLKSCAMAKIANKEMQKYKMEIAILSALILLFISALSFSESVRFFGKEHPGILIVAISVACEVVCDLRAEKNLLERIKIFFGICLVVGLLLEIVEAAKSDIQVEKLRASNLVLQTNVNSLNGAVIQLAHQYDLSTNALAEAKARLASVLPLKDMLVSVLNDIDPKIIPALKGGQTVFNLSTIPEYKFSHLHGLLTEQGSGAYCSSISSPRWWILWGNGNMVDFTIVLKPELAQ
jgi:hypothetical protein